MRTLITGGTGFIGQALCPLLAQAGHEVIILSRQSRPALPAGARSAVTELSQLAGSPVDAVVNLAGASIADGRWTEARKRLLVDSRVKTTSRLVDWIAGLERKPAVLVSGSAVGYYGEQGDAIVTEATRPAPGFTHDLCQAWEQAAVKAQQHGVRVCITRIGVVLDGDGGALAKMLPAFKFGLGGPLGSGQHYFPWIHRADMAAVIAWLIATPGATGAYNASAPNPVTNAQFTKSLGAALHRPAVLPMPAPVLKLMFGEMSEILLGSDRMVPERLLAEGFRFQYPDLDPALRAIFPQRAA